ncbi:MAG: ribosome maturation factor RimM [Anaeroplasmataceae bacterium]
MDGLVVGKILNTHGLKGELKVRNLSDFDRFYKGSKLYIEFKNNYIPVEVLNVKDYDNNILVTFKDLLDINLVEKYKGSYIWIDKSNLEELSNDEFYYYELEGKDIYNEDGIKRGVVKEVREIPQGEMLVVDVNGKNRFIPFRKEFIIDVLDDRIIIHEIEGLL